MDTNSALPLAPRDLLILSVLAVCPHHGYGIIKAVEEQSESGVLLDPANLYRCVRRMRADGWIEELGSGEDDRRRTYRITAQGRSVLRSEVRRLERLLKQVRPALAGGALNGSSARRDSIGSVDAARTAGRIMSVRR